jgi:hypothetical protein
MANVWRIPAPIVADLVFEMELLPARTHGQTAARIVLEQAGKICRLKHSGDVN